MVMREEALKMKHELLVDSPSLRGARTGLDGPSPVLGARFTAASRRSAKSKHTRGDAPRSTSTSRRKAPTVARDHCWPVLGSQEGQRLTGRQKNTSSYREVASTERSTDDAS
jgi:hypothetical protein